jgi:integrase
MNGRITQRTVTSLQPPASGNVITWDSEVPGFGVRITSAGVTAYVLDYRIHGRKRRFTIGRHPELSATQARDEAIVLRSDIRDGHDPLDQRRQDREQPTVKGLADDYLERHALVHKRPGSIRNDRGMLSGIILPRFGALTVASIGKRDIEALHANLKGTPYHANRVLSLLSKMFALSIEWGWRPDNDNPTHYVERFHEDPHEGWLSADKIGRFQKALDGYSDQNAADALRLLVLTGSREQEVLKAMWDQFDLELGIWTKPSHATKQKKQEHVPLSEAALKLLRNMKAKAGAGPFLFPGAKDGTARAVIRKPFAACCRAAGLVEEYTVTGKRGPITRWRSTIRLYDLRHSFASHLVSSGVPLLIVGKLMGHTRPDTTNRYAHLSDDAVRAAANKLAHIYRNKK